MIKDKYLKHALNKLIGMDREQAAAYMAKILPKHELRLVREDRRGFMITMDMRLNRHDIEIDNDLITKVS